MDPVDFHCIKKKKVISVYVSQKKKKKIMYILESFFFFGCGELFNASTDNLIIYII